MILEAYKNFGGTAWFNYDEPFRQKLAVHPTFKWGSKYVCLWLNLFLTQRSSYSKQSTAPQATPMSVYKKGICFNCNDAQCKWPNSCKYRHKCAFCAGAHPISKCFKRMSTFNQQQGNILKANNPNEVAKHAPMVSGFSRQAEGPASTSGILLPKFGSHGCKIVNNLKSDDDMQDVVFQKMNRELEEGRVAGPFNSPPFINFRVSPLGIVPKKQPNTYRFIPHLSFPK